MIPLLALGAIGAIGGGLAAFSGLTARKVEKAVPRDGRIVEVAGNRLHVLEKGSGPAILMIHGLAGQMRNFAASVVDDLAKDHRVVLVDRPGSGYSVRAAGAGAGLVAQAEVMAGLIDMLGLDRPLVVGHSLGGAVALALALNHPQAVGALALICPLTQVREEPPEVFRGLAIVSPAVRRAVAWTIATPLGIARAEATLAQVFAPEPVPANFGTAGGGLLGMRPNNFYEASTDMVAVNDDLPGLVARYGELKLPVDILYARGDNLLDPDVHGEQTAGQIAGARLELIEGGHMVPFTKPEETLAFLRRAAGRRGADGDADRG